MKTYSLKKKNFFKYDNLFKNIFYDRFILLIFYSLNQGRYIFSLMKGINERIKA